ncbi:MAG: hypothetical protein AAB489_00760 [Patescibacteria group bacterium]
MSTIVQPDRKNIVETSIAHSAQDVLNGKCLFVTEAQRLMEAERFLTEGLLQQARPAFRQSLLSNVVPLMETAEFHPSDFRVSDPAGAAAEAADNAKRFAVAIRAACEALPGGDAASTENNK